MPRVRYGANARWLCKYALWKQIPWKRGWHSLPLALTLLGIVGLSSGCCVHGCPTSKSPDGVADWEMELRNKQPLRIDYSSSLTVKRDLHDVIVDVEASKYAAAFHQVMIDPQRRFGLIHVNRLRENTGKPFTLGEHFQGRYDVEAAVEQQLKGKLKQWFGELADSPEVQALLCDIENRHTSDFGVISLLELSPPPGKDYVLQYRYLEGSPIAGSSTFSVTALTDPELLAKYGVQQATRLRQVFEYQETKTSFAGFFSKGGLRLHNQVVFAQADQAATAAGGKVLESDIPPEYRKP
jgi:hypothetical protein